MKVAGSLNFSDLTSFTKALGLLKLKGWVQVETDGNVRQYQVLTKMTLLLDKEENLFQVNFLQSKLNEDLDFLKFLVEFSASGVLRVVLENREELELIEVRKDGAIRVNLDSFSREIGVPINKENLPILTSFFLE